MVWVRIMARLMIKFRVMIFSLVNLGSREPCPFSQQLKLEDEILLFHNFTAININCDSFLHIKYINICQCLGSHVAAYYIH